MYKVLFIIAIFGFGSVPASAQYVTPSPVQDVQNGRCPDLSKGGPMPAIIPIYDSVTGEECEPLQPRTQQQPTQEQPQINLIVGNLTNNTIYSDSRLHIKLGVQGDTSGIKNAYFVIKDPDNGIDQVYKFQEFNKTEYVDVAVDFVHYKNVTIGALILYTDGSEEVLVYSDAIQYSKFPSDYTEGSAELPSPTNPGTWVGLTLQVADALSDATMRCIGLERSALGLDISEDNQLLSCVGIFLPNIQKVGRVVKLLNKGDETYEIVRAITRNGDTILELTPVRKTLPYVDEVIHTATNGRKLKKSWFASYKLTQGDDSYGYTHIIRNHAHNVRGGRPDGSKFFKESNIAELIEEALTTRIESATITNDITRSGELVYIVETNMQRIIGFQPVNLSTNNYKELSKLRILLLEDGTIKTAYPVK